MNIAATGITDVGLKRDRNEDAFLINDELQLYVVADGMGGHAGGEYASGLAVNTVEEILTGMELPTDYTDGQDDPVETVKSRLNEAVRLAGLRIHDWASSHPEYLGMGTTVVVLLVHEGNAYMAHVGDSRIYRIRDGSIEQVTEDHSLVAQSIREGLLTEEQAKFHRMRNVITRALGFDREVEVDVQVQAVRRGDRFLLCSDGLSGKLDDSEMLQLIERNGPQEASRQLVGLACARGGEDNITTIVVRVEDAA
jgi:serine/threonine protein phosphatase PrpC